MQNCQCDLYIALSLQSLLCGKTSRPFLLIFFGQAPIFKHIFAGDVHPFVLILQNLVCVKLFFRTRMHIKVPLKRWFHNFSETQYLTCGSELLMISYNSTYCHANL